MIFVELTHLYLDEVVDMDYHTKNVDFVKKYFITKKIDTENYNFVIFIDDINCTQNNLNIVELKNIYEYFKPKIIFESEMEKYSDDVVKILECENVKRGKKRFLAMKNGILLKQTFPENRSTCLLLSVCWSLNRIGYFSGKNFKTYTFIDEKYSKIENNVKKIMKQIGKFDVHIQYFKHN